MLSCLLCAVIVSQDVVAATAALEEVKQSGKFSRILELVLLMGNYMNSGSHNAQSIGFEISYLTRVGFAIFVRTLMNIADRCDYGLLGV